MKIDKIFQELPNVFDKAHDILAVDYDGDGAGQEDRENCMGDREASACQAVPARQEPLS